MPNDKNYKPYSPNLNIPNNLNSHLELGQIKTDKQSSTILPNMNLNPNSNSNEDTGYEKSNTDLNINMANKKVCMDYMTEALKKDMLEFMKIKKDVENNLRIWYYIDNMDKLQGPFRTDEIFTWRKTNELNGSV